MTADLSWLRRLGGAPLIVAHRGASGLAPENTMTAFRVAIDLGAPAVECDVHLTADGVPVIIHDATLDRTTSGSGSVAAHTYEQIRTLDAGAWLDGRFAGERVPALHEALDLCARRARLVVELKAGGGEALVVAALDAIERAKTTDVAVISFGLDEVRLVAQHRPDLSLGFLVSGMHLRQHGAATAVEMATSLGARFFCPQANAVDASVMAASGAAGLPVSVWTVDDPARMRELASLGVDAITTNRPDVALDQFR